MEQENKKITFNEQMNINEVVIKWQQYIREGKSTELWKKEQFEFFLNNEDVILHYTTIGFDGKLRVLKIEENGIHPVYKIKLERLREIYNKRYTPKEEKKEKGIIPPEFDAEVSLLIEELL